MTVKNMYVKTDNQVKLSDGSSIGYAEYGDPQGRPVLHLHGLPSSRLEANNPDMSEVAARLNVRLLVPDRPGIGLSDFKPYTIGNYPDMVATFADKLGLDRFAVMGLSSGGKFVAACAWKISDRLTSASIVSGTAPFDLPGVKKTLSKSDKQLYDLADKIPWLFQIMLKKIANDARKNPASVLSLFTDVCESDKQALDRPNVKMAFEQMVTEAFHQGTRGAALDWKLEARPWGFMLQEIKMPVYVWHGEEDKIVSIEQARILADAIPNACRKFVKNEGHCLIVNLFEDVLNTTIG
jgi:pimeloyl-ACP methyl ester carboxylesterase